MKISVITMTYKDPEHLLETAATVLQQDHPDLEYIIIDGGCDEETREAIRRIEEKMKTRSGTFSYVSEPDHGLYDALNKGIDKATGDLVGLMCDKFADKSVLSRMAEIVTKEGTDGVHGDLDYVEDGRVVRRWRMGQGKLEDGWMPAHPTLYLKREVYERYGRYRTDLSIAADYEFMVRCLKDGKVKLSYLPGVLVKMFHGNGSTSTSSLKSYAESFRQGKKALSDNGVPHAFGITLRRTCRVLLQFIKKK